VSTDPQAVDLGSLGDLRAAFRAAPEPSLADVVGRFEAEFIGPGWMRASGPLLMRVGRMPHWYGKRFEAADATDESLVGVNLVRRDGGVIDSVPMTAAMAPSQMDGRPAVVVSYPGDAPFPWPRVTDELRPFGEGVLLGMTFGIPLAPPGGSPFLLRRTS